MRIEGPWDVEITNFGVDRVYHTLLSSWCAMIRLRYAQTHTHTRKHIHTLTQKHSGRKLEDENGKHKETWVSSLLFVVRTFIRPLLGSTF